MGKRTCYVCNKENLKKNEIGLNRKLNGRNVKRYYCLECLAEHLEVTTEELLARIEEFKSQGCTLFE